MPYKDTRVLSKKKKLDGDDLQVSDKQSHLRRLSKISMGDELKKVRAGLLVH